MRKIFAVLFGLSFAGIGLFVWISGNAKVERCTEKTVGTVVDIKEELSTNKNGDYTYTYYLVIQYKAEGRIVTKQSNHGVSNTSKISISNGITLSSTNSKYSVNDKINILYNPNNVEEFIMDEEKSDNTVIGIVFIILGALVVIFGIIEPNS